MFDMKRIIFFFVCLFVFVVGTGAQPPCKIESISVEQGLSQSFVQGLLMDKEGLFWFATRGGLDCYDGYKISNYNMSSIGGEALTNNRIVNIQETSEGDIWCLTYDSQAILFNRSKRMFCDVLKSFKQKQNIVIRRMYAMSKGVTWLIGDNGCNFRIDDTLPVESTELRVRQYSVENRNVYSNNIYKVFQDCENDEWILTDKGITIVGKKSIKCKDAFRMISEVDNTIFLVSDSNKLAVYDSKTFDVRYIDLPTTFSGTITSMKVLAKSKLALYSTDGLLIYSLTDKKVIKYDLNTGKVDSNKIIFLYQDKNGDCWIMTEDDNIVRMNIDNNTIMHVRKSWIPSSSIISESRPFIFEDKNGTLWFFFQKRGMYFYNPYKDEIDPYLLEVGDSSSLYAPLVRFNTVDRQGNLWLSVATGINKIIFLSDFYHFRSISSEKDTRAFMLSYNGNFWVGTQKGIIRVYDTKRKFLGYVSPEGNIVQTKSSFPSGIYSLFEDNEHNIWIGTREHGLYYLEFKEKSYKLSHYQNKKTDKYSIKGNGIYDICQDDKNRVWIGCYDGGLNLVAKNKDGGLYFINSNNDLKGYPESEALKVRCLENGPDNTLLVGTTDGLLTFSTDFTSPDKIKFFQNRFQKGTHSLSGNDIMDVYRTKRNDIYILSATRGVNKLLSNNILSDSLEFKYLFQEDGLLSNLVLSVIEDEKGNLWFAMENGLSVYEPKDGRFTNYHSSVFRDKMRFSEAQPVMLPGHHLLFGTDKGFLEIAPDKVKRNSYVPPIVFTTVRVQGKALNEDFNNQDAIVLNPSQRNLSVSFSAIDYVGARNIQYAYRMMGLETDWNIVGENRMASYMNLPPGTYTLEVRSTNSDGMWMDNIRSVKIVVEPTFWETGWAWGVYIVGFIILTGIVAYILFYIYRLRHQMSVEQQLSDIKLRFFTDVSHELRTPLTLISAPVMDVLENEGLSQRAKSNLILVKNNIQRMLQMMNQILDFRKVQNKKMKLLIEYIDIIELLRKVMAHFDAVAADRRMNFSLKTNSDKVFLWLDRDKMETVFFNLISNAFKYTPDGKSIEIGVYSDKTKVCITVSDEGVGMDITNKNTLFDRFETFSYQSASPSSGIGLSLVKEFITLHHGEIHVESKVGVGSKFTVELSLSEKEYKDDPMVEFILNDSVKAREDDMEIISEIPFNNTDIHNEEIEDCNEEKLQVLIVEDNDELRLFLNNVLSESYSVIEAKNGMAGLSMVKEYVPDIIVSDVMMPVMDGLEMIRQIKTDGNLAHIPIILLTAKSSLQNRIEGIEQGVDDYVTKPFSATYLKTKINQLLRQRKELQEIYVRRLLDSFENKTIEERISDKISPSHPELVSFDDQFIKDVMAYLEENMSNIQLEIDDIVQHMCMSRTVFYKKLKAITGLAPVDFVRKVRLKRAAQLLDGDLYNISQIAYMTGFSNPKYFSKCFKAEMEMTPTEYKECEEKEL